MININQLQTVKKNELENKAKYYFKASIDV